MSADLTRQPPGESRRGDEPSRVSFSAMLIRSILFVAVQGVLLFVAAGSLSWTMGWVYLAVMLAVSLASYPVVTPELAKERTHVAENVPKWDRRLSIVLGPIMFGLLIVAGLDYRFSWSVMPLWLQWGGVILGLLAYGLIIWAIAFNPFFARFVRIQHDRSQTVASDGPYRVVRHPGNLGTSTYHVAMALMLGSWWALLPAAAVIAAIVFRTVLEDRLLMAELDGYAAYADQVRYRLLPGIW